MILNVLLVNVLLELLVVGIVVLVIVKIVIVKVFVLHVPEVVPSLLAKLAVMPVKLNVMLINV